MWRSLPSECEVVSHCISPMALGVECIHECLLPTWVSSWLKCLFMFSAHLKNQVIWHFVSCMSYLCILHIISLWDHNLQVFSPIPWVVFSLCWLCHLMCKNSSFWWSSVYFFLWLLVIFVLHHEITTKSLNRCVFLESQLGISWLAHHLWGWILVLCSPAHTTLSLWYNYIVSFKCPI